MDKSGKLFCKIIVVFWLLKADKIVVILYTGLLLLIVFSILEFDEKLLLLELFVYSVFKDNFCSLNVL